MTDPSTKKRKSSRLVTDLREVVERWIWPVGLVKTVIPSKKSNGNSLLEKAPTFSDVPLCETSTLLLHVVLGPSTVATKMNIIEWMRDGLIPLLEVEDAAVDGTVIEDVGVHSIENVRL